MSTTRKNNKSEENKQDAQFHNILIVHKVEKRKIGRKVVQFLCKRSMIIALHVRRDCVNNKEMADMLKMLPIFLCKKTIDFNIHRMLKYCCISYYPKRRQKGSLLCCSHVFHENNESWLLQQNAVIAYIFIM